MKDWLQRLSKGFQQTKEFVRDLGFGWDSQRAYFVQLHFTKEVKGRAVDRVVASLGFLSLDDEGKEIISQREELELINGEKAFTAEKILQHEGMLDEEKELRLIVRYRAYFSDGESWYSPESVMPIMNEYLVFDGREWQSALSVMRRRLRSGKKMRSICCDCLKYLGRRAA